MQASQHLQVARLNASDPASWAPEMIAYNVENVPHFVLLNARGQAVAASLPSPLRDHMAHALTTLTRKSDSI